MIGLLAIKMAWKVIFNQETNLQMDNTDHSKNSLLKYVKSKARERMQSAIYYLLEPFHYSSLDTMFNQNCKHLVTCFTYLINNLKGQNKLRKLHSYLKAVIGLPTFC
ncbi:hypothetical protein V8G54_026326 [Vigna mungo]|uniref:Uncharacterized protein n=1 Tax=Vigna mungo TaxID=3915 RepID=A0AAQ3RN37_VIGMU